MKPFLYIILFLSFIKINAQEIKKDTTRHTANFSHLYNGKAHQFNPVTSPLRQIAGAPKAHWNHYWEFGDGNYSFQEKPTHQYKENGTYTARLAATNNYDDGAVPPTRPKNISVSDLSGLTDDITDEHQLISNFNGFRIQNNREPSPNEEMQVIVSYANMKEYITNGKLYLFFNEKKFKNKNFELTDIRMHHNEETSIENEYLSALNQIKSKDQFIQTTGIENIISKSRILEDSVRVSTDLKKSITDSKAYYHDYQVWDVNNVNPNEDRNLFFTLKTTPEMLKDTSAVITIRSIYVPERGINKHKIVEQEMEIVTSHDPNKMSIYNSNMNYRLVRFKRLKYKIQFQNNGEGPASLIKLNTDIPEMLDKTTLKIIDMYPKVPLCPVAKTVSYSCMDTVISQDQISFQFKNIYLPGSNQKGVHKKDSTKGFVKYSMKFSKNFHKKRSVSKTAIIFDKNPPIITNTSTSRFKHGLSIGAKAGYNYIFPSNEDATVLGLENEATNSYFAGITISPYKSYKWYYQAEITGNTIQSGYSQQIDEISDNIISGETTFSKTSFQSETNQTYLELVPGSIRYNLNAIFGIGLGAHISANLNKKTTIDSNRKVYFYHNNILGDEITDLAEQKTTDIKDNDFSIYNYGLFTDLTIGVSRLGPSIGIRYMQNFNEPNKQLHAYAIWKF